MAGVWGHRDGLHKIDINFLTNKAPISIRSRCTVRFMQLILANLESQCKQHRTYLFKTYTAWLGTIIVQVPRHRARKH